MPRYLLVQPNAIKISFDNKYLITAGAVDKMIHVFNFETKRGIHTFENAHNGKQDNKK